MSMNRQRYAPGGWVFDVQLDRVRPLRTLVTVLVHGMSRLSINLVKQEVSYHR